MDFRIWGEVWFGDINSRVIRIEMNEVTKRMEKRSKRNSTHWEDKEELAKEIEKYNLGVRRETKST